MNAQTALEKSISNNSRLWEIIGEIDNLAKKGETKSDWIDCDEHFVRLLEYMGYNVIGNYNDDGIKALISW